MYITFRIHIRNFIAPAFALSIIKMSVGIKSFPKIVIIFLVILNLKLEGSNWDAECNIDVVGANKRGHGVVYW